MLSVDIEEDSPKRIQRIEVLHWGKSVNSISVQIFKTIIEILSMGKSPPKSQTPSKVSIKMKDSQEQPNGHGLN